jgi:hypothetical protein
MKTRLVITWLCNLIDTMITLRLYCHLGAAESNPLCAWMLGVSPLLFMAVKIGTMSLGCWTLWMRRDRWWARVLGWVVCIEYLAVAGYYVHELVWAWAYL